ncbi:gamma-glutamylcyclotransferase family protein [Marinobacterium sp. YM272]|uniref:gamma-glutamylcyclotransferase family protein n=1 Tax=Marinobacterium sp. YM272 TaxID=3421654 RepID=UPI003D7F6664
MVKKTLRFLLLAVAAMSIIVPAYLWLTLLSPWGYNPPPGLLAIDPTRTHDVFVYGTLRHPLVRWLVIGRDPETQPASLAGYRKTGLDLEADPGNKVSGEILRVSADELKRLDRYERLGIRYERVEIQLSDGITAWVYRRIH